MKIIDLIIVGSGPAGMNAAIYAKRQNLDVLILEKSAPGGQVLNTYEVENYIGVGKINGADLATKMYTDMDSFGVDYQYGDVLEIIKNDDKTITVKSDVAEYLAHAVIIASGTKPRKFGVLGEDKYSFAGISWCAICDGNFYKNKEVVVFGAANSAVEEATYLAGIASKVTLVARSYIKADQKAKDRLLSHSNVEVLEDTDLLEFIGDAKLSAVKLKNKNTSEEFILEVDGAFEFIGLIPNTDFLKGHDFLEQDYIVTNEEMETGVAGIYAVGDVRKKSLRQIATAISDGAIAAINAKKYIENL